MIGTISTESRRLYEHVQAMDYTRVVPCCRYAENPFDSLSCPMGESADEIVSKMVVNTSQIITVELFGVGIREVLKFVLITGIQIQFEVFSQICRQIIRVTLKSPSLKFAGPTIIGHTAWYFVCNLAGMSSPKLERFRRYPRSNAICYSCLRSATNADHRVFEDFF